MYGLRAATRSSVERSIFRCQWICGNILEFLCESLHLVIPEFAAIRQAASCSNPPACPRRRRVTGPQPRSSPASAWGTAHLAMGSTYPAPAAEGDGPRLSDKDALFDRLQTKFRENYIMVFPVQKIVTIVDSMHVGQDGYRWFDPATPRPARVSAEDLRDVQRILEDQCSAHDWAILVDLVQECKATAATKEYAVVMAFHNKLVTIRKHIKDHVARNKPQPCDGQAAQKQSAPASSPADGMPTGPPTPTEKSAKKATRHAKGLLTSEAEEIMSDMLAYANTKDDEIAELKQALETAQAENVQLKSKLETSHQERVKVSRRLQELVDVCQLGDDVMNLGVSMSFI
ncbi:hypothetical protein SDRG_00163 [Saprolegnia diclina VS20]|uniref:Uncharacterized protein n=1 Tax=Saprolegnia diclina (strain VS20) TaxID=1156394 RepID=T0SAR3_SAPDV|nr:hypothetical protein SDRG_00163 [Saprolegnia diclina VS20]EQC42428.1 hypothetical protein SDRG_00163 [Saprolegnia diclina VS20]|eukprot:XP_008603851.1 hypothetical protein SDRG_00163 [Saprolegnia diclina VS20]